MKEPEKQELRDRSKSFALRILKLTSSLGTRNRETNVMAHQLLRSGTSIGANYREAYRSRSKAEFVSNIGICLKEAEETIYWLELLHESRLVKKSRLEGLLSECDQLIAIFVSIRNATKKTLNS